ncbi:MAG: translation initiation factor [Candidatus Bathyarchaeia archaeon]
MVEICPVCGLPLEVCVCKEITKEQQKIKVRLELGKFKRKNTVIEGLDEKETDLSRLAQKLKALCACGGTAKNSQIFLQGDHREKIKDLLVQLGYPESNIEVQ